MDAFVAANLLCALVYGALALLALRSGRGALVLLLICACLATGLWALTAAFKHESGLLAAASGVLETLHTASWLGFRGPLQDGTGPLRARWDTPSA